MLAAVPRGPGPGHRGRRAAAACAGRRCPLHGGVVLDLTGLTGIVDVDATSLVLDVAAGTFGDVLEHDLRADHGVTVGHWPQSMALSTVGGWLACRSAPASSRPATARSRTSCSASTSPWPTARRSRPAGGPGPPSGPTSPSCSSAARARSASSPAPACGCTRRRRTSGGGAWLLGSFDDGLDVLRRIVQRGATRRSCASTTPAEADRTYHTGDKALLLALDEGDGTLVDATFERGGRGVRGGRRPPQRRRARRPLARPPQRRVGPRGAHLAGATRSTRWRWRARGPTCPPSTGRPLDALLGRRGHARRLGPPVAQLPVRRLPVLHVRRPGRRRPAATPTTGPCGTPASGPCSPTAGRSATTTASGSTGAGSWPRRSGPPSTCWRRPRPPSTPTASSTPASSACRRPGPAPSGW